MLGLLALCRLASLQAMDWSRGQPWAGLRVLPKASVQGAGSLRVSADNISLTGIMQLKLSNPLEKIIEALKAAVGDKGCI